MTAQDNYDNDVIIDKLEDKNNENRKSSHVFNDDNNKTN
jgi:hypothetical protein